MGDNPTFKVNGKVYELGPDISEDDRLVNFLFDHNLKGTHTTCFEGGCGACIVVASVPDPATGKMETYSVNSCIVPVLSCAGWEVTTIEGLGNSQDGYHVVQNRLAEYSGTQCGYCSPGFVMNMYGLTQSNPSWTPSDVEKCLDANICRCTGYRPIIAAFKSITTKDIEDSHLAKCAKTGQCIGCKCTKKANALEAKTTGYSKQAKSPKGLLPANAKAYQPTTLAELYSTIAALPAGDAYSLIVGNTAQAVVGSDSASKATIFIRNIPELAQVTQTTDHVSFGASVSIGRMMKEMKTISSSSGFAYLDHLANTWQHVAGTSVRNLGSWAGNLAVRSSHLDFPSDLFTHLAAAGATITIGSTDGSTTTHPVQEIIGMELVKNRKVILQITLPKMGDNVVFRVFKVCPRTTNAHAYVNAGLRMQVDDANAHTVVGTPVIIFGCINTTFVHASATEAALAGKSLEDETVIQAAITALTSEVTPDAKPEEASPEYKLALTQNMLYKTILGIIGTAAGSDLTSGATDLERPLSSGRQVYDQNPEIWPLGQPIPKLEAHIQCSGEAEYAMQAPILPGELFAMFVTSTQANARIVSIDASDALALPGVVAFVGKEDIKGVNNILAFAWPLAPEPLFPEERVAYYGQPIGLIVTEGREYAYAAVAAVKVTYDDIQPPILTIDAALQNPLPAGQFPQFVEGDINAGFATSTHIVEGAMGRDGQFHFAMETQVCIATPNDEGFDILASTQWAAETQRSVGKVLGVPDNRVNVTVKRIGGAFGSKISRCNIVATAAALAAQKTRSRVRLALDYGDNMSIIGWREPYMCTYKVGVDDAGVLQAVQATLTCDAGYVEVDVSVSTAASCIVSCYSCPNWEVIPQFVLTNTPNNTWCRTPGTLEGITFMENIMDHVASAIGMDPLEFRRKNLMPDGATRPVSETMMKLRCSMAGNMNPTIPKEVTISRNLIVDMIDQIVVSADVEARKQADDAFNQANKWKKRGIAVMPQLWPHSVPSSYPFNALVSVNARDGTVTVSHGGTEMGQGINTKVAQCAAYELGIPLDLIAVRGTNTHTNANSECTGGSIGSDAASFSISIACRNLKKRLDDFKVTIGQPDISWTDLILLAYNSGIDISERYVNKWNEVNSYGIFGVAVTEVEVDVLTGQYMILRTDILEDAGRSTSPLVDVGQCEGAFVFGQGLFTTEKPVYDPQSGRKINNTTWLYKPPQALDIPVDFRVTLLQNSPNPIGVQASRVTGEPPLCLAFTVVMALRQAISSARADGGTTGWFQMDTPLTVEKIQRLCLVDPSRLVLKSA